jgi:hypothetical protein
VVPARTDRASMRRVTSLAIRRAWSSDRLTPYRRVLARVGLPAWFVVIDLLWIAKPDVFAIDARHYQRAAAAWLAGGNPWAVAEQGVPYASGPHTLLFYAPTNLLPLDIAVAIWMLIGLGVAVWTVRRLDLPIWWLAFPPLAHALWNGNPQTLLVAMLVANHPLASAGAVLVKLYAGLAVLFRPRHWLVVGVALLVTLPLLPWQLYLDEGLGVARHIAGAWNGSAWRVPILLVPPTVIGLWVLRRKGAEWLAVPAIWPATQFYYVSTVLPLVARRPVLAALLAAPIPLMAPAVVIWLAARDIWERRSTTSTAPAP